MTEINDISDVSEFELEPTKNKTDKKSNRRNSTPFINNIKLPKQKPTQMNNKPIIKQQPIISDELIERHVYPLEELRTGSKKMIFKIASRPAIDKAQSLENKLVNSKYINKYLDNNLYISVLDGLNKHVKCGVLYLYYLLETKLE
jgi:hypothetical protein